MDERITRRIYTATTDVDVHRGDLASVRRLEELLALPARTDGERREAIERLGDLWERYRSQGRGAGLTSWFVENCRALGISPGFEL